MSIYEKIIDPSNTCHPAIYSWRIGSGNHRRAISKEQNTVNTQNNENVSVAFKGRHDPCIVHRARVVVDSIVAIVLCDLLSNRYGTEWLGNC